MALHERIPDTLAADLASTDDASSWFSLLAASSLGVPNAHTTSAEVRAAGGKKLGRGPLRVVVQAFADDARGRKARPVSSAQRTVTAAELRRGVRLPLVDLSGRPVSAKRVLAWVEPGQADLELDGRTARPGRKSVVGTARAQAGRATIVLREKAA